MPAHEPGIRQQSDGYGDVGYKTRSNAPAIFSLWVLPVPGTRGATGWERKWLCRMGYAGSTPGPPNSGRGHKLGRLQLWLCSQRIAAPVALVECRRTVGSSTTSSTIRSLGKDCGSQRTWAMANAQGLALQEFVIGGPVAAEGEGDPAFGRDQATAEQFEEAAPRAGRYDRQKVGNPLRQAEGNETMKGHGCDSEKPKRFYAHHHCRADAWRSTDDTRFGRCCRARGNRQVRGYFRWSLSHAQKPRRAARDAGCYGAAGVFRKGRRIAEKYPEITKLRGARRRVSPSSGKQMNDWHSNPLGISMRRG